LSPFKVPVSEPGDTELARAAAPTPTRRTSRLLGRGPVLAAVMFAALGMGAWQLGAVEHVGGSVGLSGANVAEADVASPLALPAVPAVDHHVKGARAMAAAADAAARELAGSGDASAVAWDASAGLWDRLKRVASISPANWHPPMWWQSGLALRALVRYLTRAHDAQPAYQRLISTVYERNIRRPGPESSRNFQNKFMDDTAWWGLAWLDASRYELRVRHDFARASRYLKMAESDASYIYSRPRTCGTRGIAFETGYAPNTISNAEFVSLAAQLAQVRASRGPFLDGAKAQTWLADAKQILSWLESSGLVNIATGRVASTYSAACRASGRTMTYLQGEMADALVQMGSALHDPSYFKQAAAFINRALAPSSGMVAVDGVLQEPCEAQRARCAGHSLNITVYKGLLVDAVSDWTQATGLTTFDRFLLAQARAVMANGATDGRQASHCQTPHACQLSMYWGRRMPARRSPMPTTAGSQLAGLLALTDALPLLSEGRSRCRVPVRQQCRRPRTPTPTERPRAKSTLRWARESTAPSRALFVAKRLKP
jgi:hypothetical protein